VVLSEIQAIEQLRPLIGSLIVEMTIGWDPFNNGDDDKNVQQWVKHPDNNWCSGKKEDFELLLQPEYNVGDYARTLLLVLGIKVR
jgi:hypothetical protein